MLSTSGLLKNNFHMLGKAVYSILIGVFGTILLVLFLTTLMHILGVVGFVPWIIALNTAITGYSLLEKTRNLIKYKQISAISAGIVNVITTYIILSLIFFYFAGEFLLSKWDLIVFLLIGIVCSWLGSKLAIKYFGLIK